MKGGRKNLRRAADQEIGSFEDGQNIMQVISLRGSNIIEVMNAQGHKSLALFPAKFQKSMWIKRGNFVVADESGKEKALESGSKVSCIVSQVLFHKQVRELQKSAEWPEIFKSSTQSESGENLQSCCSLEQENKFDSDDSEDDELFPLEANTNRIKPFEETETETESESGSDTD